MNAKQPVTTDKLTVKVDPLIQPEAVADTPLQKAHKARKPINPNETKEMKLSRLANKRVTSAIAKIRLIGNLAAYKPTEPQVDKIMEALGASCAGVDARLRATVKTEVAFII